MRGSEVAQRNGAAQCRVRLGFLIIVSVYYDGGSGSRQCGSAKGRHPGVVDANLNMTSSGVRACVPLRGVENHAWATETGLGKAAPC